MLRLDVVRRPPRGPVHKSNRVNSPNRVNSRGRLHTQPRPGGACTTESSDPTTSAVGLYPRDLPVAEQSDNGRSQDVSPKRAAELVAEEGAQLIDVRESDEWEAGRIEGARHVALARIPAEAESIDRDRPVVFQCRSGSRSTMVTAAFRQSGYDAYNLSGGLLAWIEDGLPIEPEDGTVANSLPDAS